MGSIVAPVGMWAGRRAVQRAGASGPVMSTGARPAAPDPSKVRRAAVVEPILPRAGFGAVIPACGDDAPAGRLDDRPVAHITTAPARYTGPVMLGVA